MPHRIASIVCNTIQANKGNMAIEYAVLVSLLAIAVYGSVNTGFVRALLGLYSIGSRI